MKNKEILIYFNKKNLNGRTYVPESYTNLNSSKEYPVVSRWEESSCLDICNICGKIVNVEITNDILEGEFILLQDYIRPEDTIIRPCSVGKVDNDGKVLDAKIICFVIIDKRLDPFK